MRPAHLLGLGVLSVAPWLGAASGRGLEFEENRGQAPPEAQYLGRAAGRPVLFTCAGVKLGDVMLSFPGSAGEAHWEPDGAPSGSITYLRGNDPSRWVHGARQYSRLAWRGVWAGVDIVFYTQAGAIEYDLVLQPGAAVDTVRLRLEGAPAVPGTGGQIEMPGAGLRQRAPVIYQSLAGGERRRVAGRFVRADKPGEFALRLDDRYLPDRPLVVDPVLEFSSFLGGDGEDRVTSVSDNLVAGTTDSVWFEGTTPSPRRDRDIFIRQLAGSISPVPATFVIGGSGDDELTGVRRGPLQQSIVLAGSTTSRNLPFALQPGPAGYRGGASDGFVAVLDTRPSFGQPALVGRYVGGSGEDHVTAVSFLFSTIAVVGVTDSPDMPVDGAPQPRLAGGTDGFVAVYDVLYTGGPILVQAVSYLGGSSDDRALAAALDVFGGVWVGGETRSDDFPLAGENTGERRGESDAFLAYLLFRRADGAPAILRQARLLGGSGQDRIDALAWRPVFPPLVSPLIAAGTTTSADFPVRGAFQAALGGETDAFVAKVDTATSEVTFASYVGGSGAEEATAVQASAIWEDFAVGGWTRSADFPVLHALQPRFAGGGSDGFFLFVDQANRPQQATYFGGGGEDRITSLTQPGDANMVYRGGGVTTSTDLPLRSPVQLEKDGGPDGFYADFGTDFIRGPDQLAMGKDMATSILLTPTRSTAAAMTVRSSDPSKVRFWVDGAPAGRVDLVGNWSFTVEALDSAGEVELTAEAPGVGRKVIRITLHPSRLTIFSEVGNLTTWTRPVDLRYWVAAWSREENRALSTGLRRPSLGTARPVWSSSDERVARVEASATSVFLTLVPTGPGTARLQVALEPFEPGTADVVVRPPALTVRDGLLGKDLQTPLSIQVGPGFAGRPRGRLTARSLDPGRLVLSRSGGAPAPTATLDFDGGEGYQNVVAHALAGSGEAPVEVRMEEAGSEQTATLTMRLAPPVVAFSTSALTIPVSANASVLQYLLRPEGAPTDAPGYQLRTGMNPPAVRVSAAPAALVELKQPEAAGQYPGVRGLAPGTAQLTLLVDPADFKTGPPLTLTITEAVHVFSVAPVAVGKDLQAVSAILLEPPLPANTEVSVRVDDPSVALVSFFDRTPGAAEIRGNDARTFLVQGLRAGSTTVRVRVAGRGEAEAPVTVGPSGFAFDSPGAMLALSANALGRFAIWPYLLEGASGMPVVRQAIRAGVRVSVNVRQDGRSVTPRSPLSYLYAADQAIADATYDGVELGDTRFEIEQPEGFVAPAKNAVHKVRVVAPRLTLAPVTLGKDTIAQTGLVNPQFKGSVTVTSADPSLVQLSTSATAAGAASVTLSSPNQPLFVHGLASEGVATLRVSGDSIEPFEAAVALAPLTVNWIASSNTNQVVLVSGTAPWRFEVRLMARNTQVAVRPGAPPLRVTLTTSDSSVVAPRPAVVEFAPGDFGPRSFEVAAGQPGRADIDVQSSAGTVVEPRLSLTVRRPGLSPISGLRIGRDLQTSVQVSPEQRLRENIVLTVTSADPGRLLVSRAADARGSASAQVILRGDSGSEPVYLQSLASEGEVDVRFSGEGLADLTTSVALVPLSLFWYNGGTAITLQRGGQTEVSLVAGVRPAGGGSGYTTQEFRAGAAPLTVGLRSSNPAAVSVPESLSMLPGNRGVGSVSLRALAAGVADVAVEPPAGVEQPPPLRVTVREPELNLNCQARVLGRDLQMQCVVSGPPRGAPVVVTSMTPGIALVSFDAAARGSGEARGTLNDGFGNFYVQMLASDGTARVVVNVSGFQEGNLLVNAAPSGFLLAAASSPGLVMNRGTTSEFGVQAVTLPPGGPPDASSRGLRPGVAPVTLELSSSQPTVAGANPATVSFGAGETAKSFRVQALAAGTTVLRLSVPAGYATPPRESVLVEVR